MAELLLRYVFMNERNILGKNVLLWDRNIYQIHLKSFAKSYLLYKEINEIKPEFKLRYGTHSYI